MFIGEYQHSIDIKSRIIVPSKFREELGARFVLTKGLDNCLFIFSMDEWNKFEEKLKNLPVASKDARAFVRYFFSGAVLSDMDRQGRLIVPQNLREHAKIDKEIVIIGVLSRVEIWGKSEWKSYNDSADLGYDAVSEKMAELGI